MKNDTSIVILLNKSDLFANELERNDFSIYKKDIPKDKSKDYSYCVKLISDQVLELSGL